MPVRPSWWKIRWRYYKFRDELKKQDPSLAADSLENELHARASILVEDTLAVL